MKNQSVRLIFTCAITGLLVTAPVFGASGFSRSLPTTVSSRLIAFQAPVDVVALNSELVILQADLARAKQEFLLPGTEAPLPNQKRMKYTDYQAAYTTWAERIKSFSIRLEKAYAQLNWIYQNRPDEKAYPQVYQVYTTCDSTYNELIDGFRKLNAPTVLQVKMVIVNDGRLNEHVSRNIGNSRADLTVEQLDQADNVSFIGSFDVVNLFLVVRQDQAFYVLQRWKERSNQPGGSEILHNDIVFSQPFALAQVQGYSPAQHMDLALSLSLTPISAQGEKFLDLQDFLDRITTYTKSE